MKLITLAASLFAGATFAGMAQAATTIDFDEFKHDGVSRIYPSVVADGFSFTADIPTSGFGFWGSATPSNADPDGAALLMWNAKTVTVRRSDGDFFSLQSLDLADIYNAGAPANALFSFFDGSKTTVQEITLDRLKGLQTFAFDQKRLLSFSYTYTGSQSVQLDNVVVDVAAGAAVPEPATWAMMILGFGAAGSVLRRRRLAMQAA